MVYHTVIQRLEANRSFKDLLLDATPPLRPFMSDLHAATLWRAYFLAVGQGLSTGAAFLVGLKAVLGSSMLRNIFPTDGSVRALLFVIAEMPTTQFLARASKAVPVVLLAVFTHRSYTTWKDHCRRLPANHFADPSLPEHVETFFWDSDVEGNPLKPRSQSETVDGGRASGIIFDKATECWFNQPRMEEGYGVHRAFNYTGMDFITFDWDTWRFGGFFIQELTIGVEITLRMLLNTTQHLLGVKQWNINMTPKTGDEEKELRFTTYYGCLNTALFLHMQGDGHIVMKGCKNFLCQDSMREYEEIVLFLDHQVDLTFDRTYVCKTDGRTSLNELEALSEHQNDFLVNEQRLWKASAIAQASGLPWDHPAVLDPSQPLPPNVDIFLPGRSYITSEDGFLTMGDVFRYPSWRDKFTVKMFQKANPVRGVDIHGDGTFAGSFDITPYLNDPNKLLPTDGTKIWLPLGQLTKMTTAFTLMDGSVCVETYGSQDVLPYLDAEGNTIAANGAWRYPKTLPCNEHLGLPDYKNVKSTSVTPASTPSSMKGKGTSDKKKLSACPFAPTGRMSGEASAVSTTPTSSVIDGPKPYQPWSYRNRAAYDAKMALLDKTFHQHDTKEEEEKEEADHEAEKKAEKSPQLPNEAPPKAEQTQEQDQPHQTPPPPALQINSTNSGAGYSVATSPHGVSNLGRTNSGIPRAREGEVADHRCSSNSGFPGSPISRPTGEDTHVAEFPFATPQSRNATALRVCHAELNQSTVVVVTQDDDEEEDDGSCLILLGPSSADDTANAPQIEQQQHQEQKQQPEGQARLPYLPLDTESMLQPTTTADASAPRPVTGKLTQRAMRDEPFNRPDQTFLLSPKSGLCQASVMAKSLLSMHTHGPVHFWANGVSLIPSKVWQLAPLTSDVTQFMNTKAVFGACWFIGDSFPVLASILARNNSQGVGLHHPEPGFDDVRNICGTRSEFHRMARHARFELQTHFQNAYKAAGLPPPPASTAHNFPIVDAVLAATAWHSCDHWNIHNQFSMEGMLDVGKTDLSGLWCSLIKPNKYVLRPDILVRNHVNNNTLTDRLLMRREDAVCRILWRHAVAHNRDYADNALSLGCAF